MRGNLEGLKPKMMHCLSAVHCWLIEWKIQNTTICDTGLRKINGLQRLACLCFSRAIWCTSTIAIESIVTLSPRHSHLDGSQNQHLQNASYSFNNPYKVRCNQYLWQTVASNSVKKFGTPRKGMLMLENEASINIALGKNDTQAKMHAIQACVHENVKRRY